MDTSVQVIEISILRYIPELVAWGIGIIVAVLMVKRGGGKAEKLLLAGCSFMFVIQLASPFLSELVQSQLWEQSMNYVSRAQAMALFVSLPMSILGLAGLVCLVYAFWLRFVTRRRELA